MWKRDPMWLWVTHAFILSPFADQHSRQCDGISPWKATLQGKQYTEHIIHTHTHTQARLHNLSQRLWGDWLSHPLTLSLYLNHTVCTIRDVSKGNGIIWELNAYSILWFTQLSQLIKILITIIKSCPHQTCSDYQVWADTIGNQINVDSHPQMKE